MKRILCVFLTVMALSAGAALAGPLYFGASVGETTIETSDNGFDFKDSDTGSKVYGGFRFLKFLGVEGSYVKFGSPSDSSGGTDVKIDATGWDAFGVGVLPMGPFEIFAKVGFVMWNTDTKVSGSGSNSDSGTDTAYGAGVAWVFGKHLGVRGEYERFEISNTDKTDLISIGADFRF